MAALRLVILAMVLTTLSFGGKRVGAQVHHVVGGDRGWDPSTDVASWSSGKSFRVGDKLWFTYSAPQSGIAEVSSKKEYEACDVSNPIRMYTDGLDKIQLDTEGLRYFASSDPESCKNGLKLHVDVVPFQPQRMIETPKMDASQGSESIMAAGPTTPSGVAHLTASLFPLIFGLLCIFTAA
ncbi:hypothetical protein FNV43_RR07902 [Rhamnella rubrinervis]|uniref:Phytocyanin domain-containing protein n=1 Tax=Rhamnella rubrinervis TaxID=2594499 RepID=A0A8K0MML2_9ROSA|nr:hypothetical protein FNV43_RR07902 [Rhamnella rubrinervis]